MIENELRAWHAAERSAEVAEHAYREVLARQVQDMGPPPLALQARARQLREEANAMLQALLAQVEGGEPGRTGTG